MVSSVVTGSLHDNFLLLENKGSQLYAQAHTLCVVQMLPHSQGLSVTICGLSHVRFKTYIFKQTKTSAPCPFHPTEMTLITFDIFEIFAAFF